MSSHDTQAANYSISCRGPKGEGTLIIKAFKDEKDAEREESEAGPLKIMTTPGTAWKFSTLVLSVKRNGSQRAKNSKTVNPCERWWWWLFFWFSTTATDQMSR